VAGGETYYFVLSSSQANANYNYEFSLKESPGHNCELPFEVNNLPYASQERLSDFSNVYGQGLPQPIQNPYSNGNFGNFFFNGPEAVYAYTPTSDGYVDARSTPNQDQSCLTVLSGCPFNATIGWDYGLGSNSFNREIKNIAVEAGETYYFVLSSFLSAADYLYTFTLEPSNGPTCEHPLEIAGLPYELDGNTKFLGNDYNETDVPSAIPNAVGSGDLSADYLNGIDVVYSYTPEEDQFVRASLYGLGDSMAIWVFTGCPFQSTHAWGYTITETNLNINNIPVSAGVTYYFVVSKKAGGSFYHSFELNESNGFDCSFLEKNIGDPCVDSNNSTRGDYVRDNCECAGIPLGATINLTIPFESSCGQRQVVVRTFIPEFNIPVIEITSGYSNSTAITISNMPVGTVDMYIEVMGALRISLNDYTLSSGVNNITINNLVRGDLNSSNSINITDLSVFAASFGTTPSDPNYLPTANLNCDSFVNVVDLSLLGVNFGMQGVSLP